MKTLLMTTALVIACALSVPATADRWQKSHYRDDYRYEKRHHRQHDHRYCDDRRDRHYTHYRGKPGVKVIIEDRRYKGRDRHVVHHHHDDEALKWIAGTLIVREILR